ncbi:ADP-ribose pyrophosphatase YjhB (NUDIX family) [Cytobacillus firmus]|uniref:ADP-ribose pyrophosphatase YjhB (NUDIX family) n=2 Tax=Cytobacillus TaxID=2675230 RepID=A0A366JRR7_CYTFI|nr:MULTISPECIES: NUDIX domain-containing protein [Cytobacillus]RBP91276.1 ADP-ribose pyrophosphatase YjhB (NUDIX family) [Cytobacillus firmus]TDX41476.1 ADP-ribose pyrophosphatase YjhB (NUDIX family) [Cytobacillus oceanisediminis]
MGVEHKRGKVWLAVSGLVISPEGYWLVVKKKYGGLKDKWSLPAGFVESGETVDEAAVREVEEETGIKCSVKGLLGLRTGVIKGEVSDNMVLFLLAAEPGQSLKVQESELFDVQYRDPKELADDPDASVLLKYILDPSESSIKPLINGINPGDTFGYTAYKLFL